MKKILVIGSSNTDYIVKVTHFPAAGETIEARSFMQARGGKGANQALAAHRSGGDVKFITCVGNDENGKNALKYYEKSALNISSSLVVDNAPSGMAMIWVSETGENSIVIVPGANNLLSPAYISEVEHEIVHADYVVLQMEIPYDTVKTVCDIAYANKKQIILNVAPAKEIDEDLIKKVDILVVNETEAETISGVKIETGAEEVIMDKLLALGAKAVVLTLGSRGCMLKSDQIYLTVPAFTVAAVDTTAAGDTFCGALAAELSRGNTWEDALIFASAAAAICVTSMGAQPSIPEEKSVRDFLKTTIY